MICYIDFIKKTEHRATQNQDNIHHQQSEEGTRPSEDKPLAEETKLHSGGAKLVSRAIAYIAIGRCAEGRGAGGGAR
jgi:hypothetical protein